MDYDIEAERRDLLEWRAALERLDGVLKEILDDPAPNTWPERRDAFDSALKAEQEAQKRYKSHWDTKLKNSERW